MIICVQYNISFVIKCILILSFMLFNFYLQLKQSKLAHIIYIMSTWPKYLCPDWSKRSNTYTSAKSTYILEDFMNKIVQSKLSNTKVFLFSLNMQINKRWLSQATSNVDLLVSSGDEVPPDL